MQHYVSSFFQGKVIWITGASSGIGEALAYAFAASKAQLILSARDKQALEKVAQSCLTLTSEVLVLPLDLAQPEGFETATKQVVAQFGRIDTLVNNAGISQRSYFVDTELSVFKRIMDINFMGTVALTKAVLPVMLAHGGGTFVAVTSVVGKYGTPLRTAYSASKHALHGFFDALRAETHDKGIKVMLACPGYVKTNISYNALVGDGSAQGTMDPGQAAGLAPEQCAKSILKGLEKGKLEIYPAGLKELSGVYMKRFFPGIMAKIVRKVNVR
jgi:short-subunit dehydrogenase